MFLHKAASYFILDNNTSFLLVCFRDGVALCRICDFKNYFYANGNFTNDVVILLCGERKGGDFYER